MSSSETTQIQKKGLGRGLGSLLGGGDILEEKKTAPAAAVQAGPIAVKQEIAVQANVPEEARIWNLGVEKLIPNPRQPRKEFDPEKLKELASSIKETGILQPIVARKSGKAFEIIAGERRWRAAQQAGLHEVPVIIRKAEDRESLELALIENIQRHDLNSIDEGEAYQQLVEKFNLTQEQIASRVGKDRTTVTNTLRLLGLAPQVKELLRSGNLSVGHAKVLLSVTDHKKQEQLAKRCLALRLSVRALEKMIKGTEPESKTAELEIDVAQKLIKNLSEELQKTLGTKVQIDYAKGKGKIAIQFYSDDELNQMVEKLRKAWS